jgi:hypothetical protein
MSKPLWRGQLFVHQIENDSKYKDVVRISQATLRAPGSDKPVLSKNDVYMMKANGKSVWVALRGSYNNGVSMDAITRAKLGIKPDKSYHFEFYKTGWTGQFLWAWSATDPAYRIATRLGAISLALGAVGALLGIWSIYLSLKQ